MVDQRLMMGLLLLVLGSLSGSHAAWARPAKSAKGPVIFKITALVLQPDQSIMVQVHNVSQNGPARNTAPNCHLDVTVNDVAYKNTIALRVPRPREADTSTLISLSSLGVFPKDGTSVVVGAQIGKCVFPSTSAGAPVKAILRDFIFTP